jgi:hypothetical protein
MQFRIPEGYIAWCNLCDVGFKTMDESTEHAKDFLNKHRLIIGRIEEENEKRREQLAQQ